MNQILLLLRRVVTLILILIGDARDMELRSKGGRRPKGVRSQITCRVPADYRPVLEEAARKAGLPLSDYVAVVLGEHHGLSIPSYAEENQQQERLPISA